MTMINNMVNMKLLIFDISVHINIFKENENCVENIQKKIDKINEMIDLYPEEADIKNDFVEVFVEFKHILQKINKEIPSYSVNQNNTGLICNWIDSTLFLYNKSIDFLEKGFLAHKQVLKIKNLIEKQFEFYHFDNDTFVYNKKMKAFLYSEEFLQTQFYNRRFSDDEDMSLEERKEFLNKNYESVMEAIKYTAFNNQLPANVLIEDIQEKLFPLFEKFKVSNNKFNDFNVVKEVPS